MHLDTGTLGAKRQSFHAISPRSVLLSVVEQYPRENVEKLFEIVLEKLSENPDAMRAVAEYWFANEYRRLAKPASGGRTLQGAVSRHQKEADVANLKQNLTRVVEERVAIVLSEVLMPSGVRLRDSTKAECAATGGWMSRLADGMRDDQRVGDVYDEHKLRSAFLGAEDETPPQGAAV